MTTYHRVRYYYSLINITSWELDIKERTSIIQLTDADWTEIREQLEDDDGATEEDAIHYQASTILSRQLERIPIWYGRGTNDSICTTDIRVRPFIISADKIDTESSSNKNRLAEYIFEHKKDMSDVLYKDLMELL